METKRVITVAQKAMPHIKKGDPLLSPLSFDEELVFTEGEQVQLVSPVGQFLGEAYLAKQNKGIGWIYSFQEGVDFDYSYFLKQFKKAVERREGLLSSAETNASRLFNAEGDGIPGLSVDYYAGFAVMSWYSEGIYQYREDILAAFREVFQFVKGVYEKRRYQQDGETASDFVYGEEAPSPHYIKENNVIYATYLNEGWMTGIFLDQREVRRELMETYAPGKTVLNTFSYTGAFSVAAAMGGATHTTSVDVANRSREKTREQFEVNGLDPDAHKIYVMDVFDYIQYAKRKALTFDVIVVDPPSFARSKKRLFSVTKDYTAMIEDLIDISAPKGVFILSSNAATYKRKKFRSDLETAFRNKGIGYSIAAEHRLPADFRTPKASPSSDYLKVFIIQKH
ncbi:Ribosomal RNA large subunit methyltransferase I [Jeotgalibaca dankookensis]|uniref:Ribosomal RNA large subunit methyltransferase I n=1 Tax=Jeotgalibaca dankookensis TaxID=708126 RepID=A0A1S6ILP0_9LACT|nr:class I SAM-dependent rRNA methyltransferase [Jeotgalibaca dankookensis]AQS52453.1 Ribosomal RNA large subunit methyltransferase I [Jeotgalibaca dankookensis]